jgi:hypothetical protein
MVRAPALLLVAALPVTAGCASGPPKRPPGQPPTPATVTSKNPGGDADDPALAALQRLEKEPWGSRKDRWNTLRVPLADWKHWRRVKFWGHPLRAGFRYGDEHYAVTILWYEPTDGPDDPDACLSKFLDFGAPVARSFQVELSPVKITHAKLKVGAEQKTMAIALVDGKYSSFGSEEYAGAIAAYPSWPGTCLVAGFAAEATDHPELAARVRDRWVKEGAPRLRWERRVKSAPKFQNK